MRSKTSRFCLCISLSASIAGCTLEQPLEYGEGCEKIQFIWTDGSHVILPEDPGNYKFNFNNHVCPSDAPFCMTLLKARVGDEIYGDQHFCSDRRESCPDNAHPYGGGCERDTPQHCGSHDINCLDRSQGVAEADCIDGATGKICKPNSCLQTFALLDNACRRGDQCCGSYCNDCTRLPAHPYCYMLEDMVTMECGDHCPYNAELICNGVCIDSSTSMAFCGSNDCKIHYCPDEPGWRNGSCIQSQCQASDCIAGYHLVKGEPNHCEIDTVEACGSKQRNCTEIAQATAVTCEYGQCNVTACEAGYYAYDDRCEEIQGAQCGNVYCRVHQVCNPDTQLCECATGYTDCYGNCYDLTSNANHCGTCNTICKSQVSNARNQCVNSTCTFECETGFQYNETTKSCEESGISCNTGYHANGSECEADSIENCGKHGLSCHVENAQNVCNEGKCAFECHPNYHKEANICVPNSVGDCIEEQKKCDKNNIPQICDHGEWVYCSPHICDENMCLKCSSNQHIYENACEDDTADHCGSHENSCNAPAHATAICTNGACDFECDGDYTKQGDSCIPTSSSCTTPNATRCINVGTQGKMQKCESNEWQNQKNCDNGYSCNTSGTACGYCKNNNTRCNDRTPQLCVKGNWDNSGICDDEQICRDGTCNWCDNTEHVWGNECEEDDTDNCGEHGYICPEPPNGSAICINSTCDIECDTGYYKQGNDCVEDTSYCTPKGATRCKGRIPQTCQSNAWSGDTECDSQEYCYEGECKLCVDGYHLNSDGTGCEESTIKDCGPQHKKCRVENARNDCIDDECTFECNSGFHKNSAGTGCENNTINDCGPEHRKCPVPEHGSATCPDGSCGKECDPGYKLSGGACVEDDTYCSPNGSKRCLGRIPQTCQSNAWSGSDECAADKICDAGSCGACDSGYHVKEDGTGCEPSTVEDCGPEHEDCRLANADNECINDHCVHSCHTGYCWDSINKKCAATNTTSDPNNCGSCSHACSLDDFPNATALTCASGTCKATSCVVTNPGEYQFSLNDGFCEPVLYSCDGYGPDNTPEYLCYLPGKQCSDPSCHSLNNDLVNCGDYYCIENALCDQPALFFTEGTGCFKAPNP